MKCPTLIAVNQMQHGSKSASIAGIVCKLSEGVAKKTDTVNSQPKPLDRVSTSL